MKLLKFVLAIFCCFLIVICGNAKAAENKSGAKAEAKKAVLRSLKDPWSAHFGKFTQVDEYACLTVNARNTYGGYTGDQQAWLSKINKKWIVVSIDEMSHASCVELTKRIATKKHAETAAKKAVINHLKDSDVTFGDFTLINDKSACLTINPRDSEDGNAEGQQARLTKTGKKWTILDIQDIRHETCVKKLDNDSENTAKYQYSDEIDFENTPSTANDIDKVEDKAIIKLKASYQSRFEHDIADGNTRFLNTDDIQFGSFLRRFENSVYGVWRYPAEAVKKGVEGIIPVKITFNRRGEIVGKELLQSSGSRILDAEVLRTLDQVGPVGGFPKGYDKETFNLIAFFHYGISQGVTRSLR